MIAFFEEFNRTLPEQLEKIKEKYNKKMVGWNCGYAPIEVIFAADMIPVRTFSTPDTLVEADVHMPTFTCNVTRGNLERLMRGDYDCLDVMITPNACDGLLMSNEIYKVNKICEHCHLLQLPVEVVSKASRIWWDGEIKGLMRKLEAISGVEITDAALTTSLKKVNDIRKNLAELYEYRNKGYISAAEFIQVAVAVESAPVPEVVDEVRKLNEYLKTVGEEKPCQAKLLLVGGSVDLSELDIIQQFENVGARFVAELTCTGAGFVRPVESLGGTALEDIENYYHNSIICAARHPSDARLQVMKKLAVDNNVQGVVMIIEKFCDPFDFLEPVATEMFHEMNIPVVVIENGESNAQGQVRTRAQGFIEIINGL